MGRRERRRGTQSDKLDPLSNHLWKAQCCRKVPENVVLSVPSDACSAQRKKHFQTFVDSSQGLVQPWDLIISFIYFQIAEGVSRLRRSCHRFPARPFALHSPELPSTEAGHGRCPAGARPQSVCDAGPTLISGGGGGSGHEDQVRASAPAQQLASGHPPPDGSGDRGTWAVTCTWTLAQDSSLTFLEKVLQLGLGAGSAANASVRPVSAYRGLGGRGVSASASASPHPALSLRPDDGEKGPPAQPWWPCPLCAPRVLSLACPWYLCTRSEMWRMEKTR